MSCILSINIGSSSLKVALFVVQHEAVLQEQARRRLPLDPATVTRFVSELGVTPTLISHRWVHGGELLTAPRRLDVALLQQLTGLTALAPLHNPAALAVMEACDEAFPEAIQCVVPDTGYFHALPEVATRYALPEVLCRQHGIRRYGFHGLAHQAMVEAWQARHPEYAATTRLISLQLGAGCSITASRGGVPIATSMGFSPLEGLMMATRCGDIDAGVLLHLQRSAGFSVDQLDRLLNEQSGLLGVSGKSGDLRLLLNDESVEAGFAVELFLYRLQHYLGAYVALLEGVDVILFGGGIGEGSAAIRARLLERFGWLGIAIDPVTNAADSDQMRTIAAASSSVELWVVPVDEERLLAEIAMAVIAAD